MLMYLIIFSKNINKEYLCALKELHDTVKFILNNSVMEAAEPAFHKEGQKIHLQI